MTKLNNGISLTEYDKEELLYALEYNHDTRTFPENPKELHKQILNNQAIVDELLKCYRECRARQENLAISQFETDQQLFMEKLYKRATGKDIKEILGNTVHSKCSTEES